MQIHFEKVAQRLSPAIGFLAFALGLPAQSCAQTSGVPQWSGIWNAEGSLLTLRVTHIDDQLHVEPVESLGFQWRNSVGQINGSSATIDVEYQGVVATVLVQLGEGGTAMVRPLSCQPDYHVVCALVQNQQARFRKVGESIAQGAAVTTSAAMTD
jgi:hypothetical protein